MQVLAIADDTTGAIETGAMVAKSGVRALVSLNTNPLPDANAVVVDAQTRHIQAGEARKRVERLAAQARSAGAPHIFKKTDSTLRGNIPAEFEALLAIYPERLLVYAPAYPRMGRVVIGGELYVHGRRLAETPFARDPLSPSAESAIPKLLTRGCGAPVVLASAKQQIKSLLMQVPPGAILLCDGESDEDLWAVAEALAESGRPCVAAGTAGFCEPWVRTLRLARGDVVRRPAVTRCLVANGSLHPASLRQVQRAAGEIPVVTLPESPAGDASAAAALLGAFERHAWAALATPGTCPEGVVERISAVSKVAISSGIVDGLVVFGGDTARAVLEALSVRVVEPCRELLPGVPVSLVRMGPRDLTLVTKAGGFGDPETLLAVRAALEEGS